MSNISLTERYQALKNTLITRMMLGDAEDKCQKDLDDIYDRIVHAPVDTINAAIEKLSFAHHCLTEEQDLKETANLLCQVRDALESFEKRD
ncbi:MAG TPA: hypothetical protein HPQ04_02730 [Rhodospirillaceae bacterium]|nr:hypothetical protein [Rhodospirillaceae bacterium]